MEQNTIRSNRWNEAARYGLIFGAISTAYIYMDRLIVVSGLTGTLGSILSFVLWAAKFVGCIKLMKYVMQKFSHENPSAQRSDIFKLGRNIAVLSALVFATFSVADMMYISTEYYRVSYTTIITELSKTLPAQNIEEMKNMLVDLPKYTFIGTFIYCSLFGLVLSFILSRNIPSQNPFIINNTDEQ
jgi:hypothetical protein